MHEVLGGQAVQPRPSKILVSEHYGLARFGLVGTAQAPGPNS